MATKTATKTAEEIAEAKAIERAEARANSMKAEMRKFESNKLTTNVKLTATESLGAIALLASFIKDVFKIFKIGSHAASNLTTDIMEDFAKDNEFDRQLKDIIKGKVLKGTKLNDIEQKFYDDNMA